MSGPHEPPPEVPDEFAAAYRAAYEEAMRASAPTGSHRAAGADAEPGGPGGPGEPAGSTGRAAPGTSAAERWRAVRSAAGERWAATAQATAAAVGGWRRQRWFLPVLGGVGAVLLVVAAYLLGRAFSDDGTGAAGPRTDASGRAVYAGDSSTGSPGSPAVSTGKAWRGDVEPVTPTRVRASCTAPASVDSGGARVSYRAANVADGDASTAWRCAGSAAGVRLVLVLPGATPLGEVGLVPGYAKTDPVSHADRYAQNNRVTRVRWTIGDITVEQTLDGSPDNRQLQLLRIPRTTAARVTLEILDVARGPRNTTAISEVELGEAVS
jgi:hypothetical protein